MENASSSMTSTREKLDRYTEELARHGLESAEREVRWIEELIASERQSSTATERNSTTTTSKPTTVNQNKGVDA